MTLLTIGAQYKVNLAGRYFFGTFGGEDDEFMVFTDLREQKQVFVPKGSAQSIEEVKA